MIVFYLFFTLLFVGPFQLQSMQQDLEKVGERLDNIEQLLISQQPTMIGRTITSVDTLYKGFKILLGMSVVSIGIGIWYYLPKKSDAENIKKEFRNDADGLYELWKQQNEKTNEALQGIQNEVTNLNGAVQKITNDSKDQFQNVLGAIDHTKNSIGNNINSLDENYATNVNHIHTEFTNQSDTHQQKFTSIMDCLNNTLKTNSGKTLDLIAKNYAATNKKIDEINRINQENLDILNSVNRDSSNSSSNITVTKSASVLSPFELTD